MDNADRFEIADFLQIQALIHSYPKHLDSGDLDGVGLLFQHASVYFENLDAPVVCAPTEITRMFTDFLQMYDGSPRTRHLICNVIITPESATRATATSTVLVVQQTPTLPLQPIITGDYNDIFLKVEDDWQFHERRITNDLFGDLNAHGKYTYGN